LRLHTSACGTANQTTFRSLSTASPDPALVATIEHTVDRLAARSWRKAVLMTGLIGRRLWRNRCGKNLEFSG
jgi:hypothetical protein